MPTFQPAERWAMAYTAPNPDHFVVGSGITSTRAEAWDYALGIWFNRLWSGGEYWYVQFQSTADKLHPRPTFSRHSAIRKLREERGVRVIRVKVVPA